MVVKESGLLKIKFKRLHIVAIGGIGMSSIAQILLAQGFIVSGSDIRESQNTRRLETQGARIFIGHRAENVKEADVVVYSSVIRDDNPEIAAARVAGIPVISRAEMLAELMRIKDGIAISGSHGKTTTSSLLAWILCEAEFDPTCLIGGRLESFDSNARVGQSRYLVAEADESDGSFLKISPVMNVITNIDPEHLEHYGDFGRLVEAFLTFANSVPFYGMNVMCIEHPVVRRILPNVQRRYLTYGFGEEADFRAVEIESESLTQCFTVFRKNRELGRVTLHLPGRYNVLNALAATACAHELEIPFETIASALGSFKGVDRRFQVKGRVAGITVVDDYGHHPEEIRAALRAAKENFGGRVVAFFQPHRYSRVRDLFDEFTHAFQDADDLTVVDIYAAGEAPVSGISGEALAESIAKAGHPNVRYHADMHAAARDRAADLQPGDLFLTLGAGDIKQAGITLLEALESIHPKREESP